MAGAVLGDLTEGKHVERVLVGIKAKGVTWAKAASVFNAAKAIAITRCSQSRGTALVFVQWLERLQQGLLWVLALQLVQATASGRRR